MNRNASFVRCANGHIIPDGAAFCPWCGEAARSEVPAGGGTVLIPSGGESDGRQTVRLDGAPGKSGQTVVQYRSSAREKEAGAGRLVGWLVCYDEKKTGVAHALHEGRQIIGRSEDADIRIDDGELSREHAVILNRGGRFIFEDRLSSNGSRINGKETTEKVALSHGDVIEMGRCRYVFVEIPHLDLLAGTDGGEAAPDDRGEAR